MELHSENIVLFDDGGKLSSVFACSGGGGDHRRLKGMGVVDKGVGCDVTQQARALRGRVLPDQTFPYQQRVPSDVRRFHRRWKRPASAAKNSCSRKLGSLVAALEQPLHSQAYPKEWLARFRALQHSISQSRVVEAAQRGEVADAGQNDLVRGCDGFRLRGYDDFSAEVVEGLLHRIQVASTIIHDGDRWRDHSSPLVLGSMRPRRRSREQATRSARAKALHNASIL